VSSRQTNTGAKIVSKKNTGAKMAQDIGHVFMSRTVSAKKQYFSLTTNQRTILLAMTFQRSE
jgi:hypothetical protein